MTTITTDRWVVDNQPSRRWPIYTRGNVGEVFPDVVTPLGWSLLGPTAEVGWRDAYRTLGVTRRADFTQDMEILGIFNGYCYLNASILRVSGVRAPGSSPEAVDQQLIGDSSAPPYEERRGDNALSCRLRMLRSVRKMLRQSDMPQLALETKELAESHLRRRPPLDAPDEVLLDYITSTFLTDIRTMFASHINLTTQSSLVVGYLAWLCLRAGDLGLLVGVSTDLGDVESAAPAEAMWELSRLVRANPATIATFDVGIEGLDQRLRATPGAADFVARFDDFLIEHGHRGPNEWELASTTWRTEPAIALVAIDRMRLTGDERAPEHQRQRAAAIREAATAEMVDNLSFIDRRSFSMVIEASAALARGREMTRNQNIVVVNAAREVLYELAQRAQRGGGVNPEAAFMLEWDDFVRYLEDPAPYLPTIAERDELRCMLDVVNPPFVIASEVLTIDELLSASAKEYTIVPEGTELQGNAGSPGVARGRARIVRHPSEPGDLCQGDILIAPLTDPSWTPLFLAASGVVVDVGATVSHAVVVSRELCIPCVIGVHDATEIIPDGAIVEIDGSSGVVRVIEHPPAHPGPAPDAGSDVGEADVAPGVSETDDVVRIDHDLGLSREEVVGLLGGKGAGLAEMAIRLNLPVPPAFVITTNACRSYLDGHWPDGLEARIDTALGELGDRLGRSFGDPTRPMLVSVRSGAAVSMPGMMDTVLNVGMNPTIRDGLARETGDPMFAAATWLRFCRMYAEIVAGMSRDAVEQVVGEPVEVAEMNAAAEQLVTAADIPHDPHLQVRAAVEAVFTSWRSPRAVLFRQTEGIDHDLGTAVTVQAMVFGNLDEQSGTGVVFTRNPATGADGPYGDYLAMAQGEDVVAGTHQVDGLDTLAGRSPAVYGELLSICDRLERHYADMCDIEFTVASGRLFILQTRIGRRSPEATIRIAARMAEDPEFPLTKAQAVARIDHATLEGVAGAAAVKPDAVVLTEGVAASPGVGVGILCCDPDRAAELAGGGENVILVRAETSPADVHGMVSAAGLVTSLGGTVSHAAVVARSWGIPAVTGASAVQIVDGGIQIGDVFLADGSLITVDGTEGRLFEGDQLDADHQRDLPELNMLRRWAVDLGVELGPSGEVAVSAEAVEHRDVATFDVIRAIQLKGVCPADIAALALGTDVAAIDAALGRVSELVADTPRGWRLTPDGHTWLDEQLATERAGIDHTAIAAQYERFLPLNQDFKVLVTGWQMTERDDAALASVITDLGSLHGSFAPLVAESIDLASRLAPYAARFERALVGLADGDASMLASPLKDSYHTVWFEYHEELIHLVDRTRLEEERSEQ